MSAVNNSTSSNNTNSISSEAEAIIEKDLSFATQEIEKFSKMLASMEDEPGTFFWMLNLRRHYSTLENVARQLHPETLGNFEAILKIARIAKESFSAVLEPVQVGLPLGVVLEELGANMLAPAATDRTLLMENAILFVESGYPTLGANKKTILRQTLPREDMQEAYLNFLKDPDFKAELIARCPAYKDELKLFEDEDLQLHTVVYCLTAPEEKIHKRFRGMRNDPAISALYQELLQLPCFGNFDTPLLKIISEYGVDLKALFTKYFGSKTE